MLLCISVLSCFAVAPATESGMLTDDDFTNLMFYFDELPQLDPDLTFRDFNVDEFDDFDKFMSYRPAFSRQRIHSNCMKTNEFSA